MVCLVLTSAREHYSRSVLIAERATREASRVKGRGLVAVAGQVVLHQVTQARASEAAVVAMLAEQGMTELPPSSLNALAFTTATDALSQMLDAAGDSGFVRLVQSLVQSAGRSAESVSSAARDVGHVRMVNPPCCGRCAVLAGRVYRYSTGFLRHPGCDCVMVPTTVANPDFRQDPDDLMRRGLVAGLSKADASALKAGADFGQVVNVRKQSAGLSQAGSVLARRGRPTPEGIYRLASDNAEVVALLKRFGYLR